MNLLAMVTLALISTPSSASEQPDLRRIEVIDAASRYGRVYLEDWDDDGRTELIFIQAAYQDGECNGCQDLDLVKIYEPREGKWAVERAFITGMGDFPLKTKVEIQWENIKPVIFEGDFNQDGIPDRLGSDPKEPEPTAASCTVWFEQAGERLFNDYIYGPNAFDERIQWLRAFDFDGDGAQEIGAYTARGMNGAYLTIYGTKNSVWHGGTVNTEYLTLGEGFRFIERLYVEAPEAKPPVSAALSAISTTKQLPDEDGMEPTTYRYRVKISAEESSGVSDVRPWRDHFMNHAIGFVRDLDTSSKSSAEHFHHMRMKSVGDDAVEIETEFRRSFELISPGTCTLWLECPFVERAPNPVAWVGTLSTSTLEVEIADWSPKKENAASDSVPEVTRP